MIVYFSWKTGFDISSKLESLHEIKLQNLFSVEKRNISKFSYMKFYRVCLVLKGMDTDLRVIILTWK